MADPVSETPKREIEEILKDDRSGWTETLSNCAIGTNYLRSGDWFALIQELDCYARETAALREQVAKLEAERDEAREQLKRTWERAAGLEAQRDAAEARAEAVEQARREALEEAAKVCKTMREEWAAKHPGPKSGTTGAFDAAYCSALDNAETNIRALAQEKK